MREQQPYRLQERFRATLTESSSSYAEADRINGTIPKPVGHLGRVLLPRF